MRLGSLPSEEIRMDIEHNKKVVRRLLDEVVGQGDIAVIDELEPLLPGAHLHEPPHSPSHAAC